MHINWENIYVVKSAGHKLDMVCKPVWKYLRSLWKWQV